MQFTKAHTKLDYRDTRKGYRYCGWKCQYLHWYRVIYFVLAAFCRNNNRPEAMSTFACSWGKHSYRILRPSVYKVWMMPSSGFGWFFSESKMAEANIWKWDISISVLHVASSIFAYGELRWGVGGLLPESWLHAFVKLVWVLRRSKRQRKNWKLQQSQLWAGFGRVHAIANKAHLLW